MTCNVVQLHLTQPPSGEHGWTPEQDWRRWVWRQGGTVSWLGSGLFWLIVSPSCCRPLIVTLHEHRTQRDTDRTRLDFTKRFIPIPRIIHMHPDSLKEKWCSWFICTGHLVCCYNSSDRMTYAPKSWCEQVIPTVMLEINKICCEQQSGKWFCMCVKSRITLYSSYAVYQRLQKSKWVQINH